MIRSASLASTAITGLVGAADKARLLKDNGSFQAGSVTASAIATTVPRASAASANSGGLLSSFNVAEVLQLTDTPPIDIDSLKAPLGTRDFLSEAIKRSKVAYANGDDTVTKSVTERYTQSDVDTIRAATGYNLVVMNNLTTVVDDNGNPPPGDIGMQVMNLAGSIEMARLGGALVGEMTPEYVTDTFSGFAAAGTRLPDDWMDKALAHLNGADKKL